MAQANTCTRKREQRSSQALKEKDVELQLERREKERAEKELKLLQHRIALLEKNLRIKNVDEQKLSKPKKYRQDSESTKTEEPSKAVFFFIKSNVKRHQDQ